MEISFFALPSKQGFVQGRFKPAHTGWYLSAKAYGEACDEPLGHELEAEWLSRVVRRFETATALNHGRTEAKKDISMLGPLGSVTNSHWALANGKERYRFKELKCYDMRNMI
jgi:hypothetical protein